MDEENLKILLERLDAQDETIKALTSRVDEVTSMNRALLSRSAPTGPEKSDEERLKEIDEKIKKGLRK